jgi:AbrB family looped-hinge helix DNA binding protein
MEHYAIKMQKGGRLTIPAPIRRLLNLKNGDPLKIEYRASKLICTPPK